MDRSELMALTVKELRAKAEKLDVKRTSSLNKQALVEAILKAEGVKAAAPAGKNKTAGRTTAANEKKAADKAENTAASAKQSGVVAADKNESVKDVEKAEDVADEQAESVEEKVEATDTVATDKAVSVKKSKKAVKDGEITDEDVEDVDAETEEDEEDDNDATKETEKEPDPVEPDSIFIDHGAVLPEYVPGTCLYALVRDPGTLFVYWNATFESRNGWLLTAYDAAGNVLQSFTTPARRNGRGYFHIPTVRVARVTLSVVTEQGSSELRLESKIKIAQQLGIAQPAPAFDERWVDVQNHEVVYEAPAPGRAPAFFEVFQDMTGQAMTGGGFDRTVETRNGTVAGAAGSASNPCGSTSSRFGALNAPGSSDTLVASSGSLVRR